jgi:hypothetical protein
MAVTPELRQPAQSIEIRGLSSADHWAVAYRC